MFALMRAKLPAASAAGRSASHGSGRSGIRRPSRPRAAVGGAVAVTYVENVTNARVGSGTGPLTTAPVRFAAFGDSGGGGADQRALLSATLDGLSGLKEQSAKLAEAISGFKLHAAAQTPRR